VRGASAAGGAPSTAGGRAVHSAAAPISPQLTNNGFLNADDMLLDITGVTGSITTSSFI
jgi:hypothetical protein